MVYDNNGNISTIEYRLRTGYYDGYYAWQTERSIQSAKSHLARNVETVNLGEGCWVGWLITLLSTGVVGFVKEGVDLLNG